MESDELFDQAAANGFGAVMYDASKLTYAENVGATAATVRRGHTRGLWVESELGEVGGKDGTHAPGARTDPVEAAAYVAATGVDALAVCHVLRYAPYTRLVKGLLAEGRIGRLVSVEHLEPVGYLAVRHASAPRRMALVTATR